jgi:hypothetical protein
LPVIEAHRMALVADHDAGALAAQDHIGGDQPLGRAALHPDRIRGHLAE